MLDVATSTSDSCSQIMSAYLLGLYTDIENKIDASRDAWFSYLVSELIMIKSRAILKPI